MEESPQKKKKKEKSEKKSNSMALVNILPKNIQECKDLFFESECTLDPQLEYDNLEAT